MIADAAACLSEPSRPFRETASLPRTEISSTMKSVVDDILEALSGLAVGASSIGDVSRSKTGRFSGHPCHPAGSADMLGENRVYRLPTLDKRNGLTQCVGDP